MNLAPIVIDFETFYTSAYSLKKIDTILYVRDPRFEVIGFSYRLVGQAAKWFTGSFEEVRSKLLSLDLDKREVCAHHAMFDGAILEWIFDIHPAKYFCTMMAARPFVVPFAGTASLRACAAYWGLPDKGDYVEKVEGKNRKDFTANQLVDYAIYCCNDTDLSFELRTITKGLLPQDEIDLIDLTIKKFTRPRLILDVDLLEAAREQVKDREAKASIVLAGLKMVREDVTSNERFAKALIAKGVTAPKKVSPTTGKLTWAFSKKDPEFTALLMHSNTDVVQMIQARLLLKSSIDRTRVEQFLQIWKVSPCMPVPLLYYGAHTGRFSGMMGINMQNLPRGSELRKALRAPPGHVVIVADLSSIEARITAVLAGQLDLIRMFADGVDVYAAFASKIYEKAIELITEQERFVGKECILGLGFGMGADKFAITMAARGIPMSAIRAKEIVELYRSTYRKIKQLWRNLDKAIAQMSTLAVGSQAWHGFPADAENPLFKIYREAIELPNGMKLNYPGIGTSANDPDHYMFSTYPRPGVQVRSSIWGGGLTENIAQALARIVLSRAELRLARAGLVSVMQVHDELVFVVPEHTAVAVTEVIRRVLTDPVPWMPTLPLACKINSGASYGEAK